MRRRQKKNESVGGLWRGRKRMTRGSRWERYGPGEMKSDVGEGETRRKKQTPNSLFSLSNSGGVRTEGRAGERERERSEEEPERAWEGFTHIPQVWHGKRGHPGKKSSCLERAWTPEVRLSGFYLLVSFRLSGVKNPVHSGVLTVRTSLLLYPGEFHWFFPLI